MTLRLFISYSHRDDHYLDRLHVHLTQAMRQGVFNGWYDREISAGGDIDEEVKRELELADIFIALVSPDYIASDYCYNKELARALERRASDTMKVVPIIVHDCDWKSTPLGGLKAIPKDGKPISEWTNENTAFAEIVRALRALAPNERPVEVKSAAPPAYSEPSATAQDVAATGRRYRVQRKFSRIDKDQFADEAFALIKKHFEASVKELNEVQGLRGRIATRSESAFACTVENAPLGQSETVWIRRGGSMGDLNIAYGPNAGENTSNGSFSIQFDDFELYIMPIFFHLGREKERMTAEEAARCIWEDLLSHVGIESA